MVHEHRVSENANGDRRVEEGYDGALQKLHEVRRFVKLSYKGS